MDNLINNLKDMDTSAEPQNYYGPDEYLERIDFVMLAAMALHRYGASADRIETISSIMAQKLGLWAEFFSIPTGIFACFKKNDLSAFTRLERLPLGKVNLEKYCLVDLTIDSVLEQNFTLKMGRESINAIVEKKTLFPSYAVTLSHALIAASVAIFLGGSNNDTLLAMILSFFVGVFSETVRIERIDSINEAVLAFSVTLAMGFSLWLGFHINYQLVLLSSLIVLIPGLNLTTSILELTSQNLTSGTARMMGAILGLFKLAFGIFLGTKIIQNLGISFHEVQSTTHPLWLKSIALTFGSLGLVVNFQARLKDAIWIIVICFISFWSSQIYQNFVEAPASSFLAGITIALSSNIMSRLLNRPILVFLLPALIFLVPGAIGYRSLNYLFHEDILLGIKNALQTINIGMALVGGLFFGNLILKPRRTL